METEPILQKPKNPSGRKTPFVLFAITTILISSIFGAIFGFMSGGVVQKIAPSLFRQFPSILAPGKKTQDIIKETIVQEDSAVIDVVEKSAPAVASVIISKDVSTMQDFFSNPFGFPDFFGNPFDQNPGGSNGQGGSQKQQIGGGSGFFITSDGMIVTNKHV